MRSIKLDDAMDLSENVRIYRHLHTEPEPPHTHEFFEIAYVYSGCGYQIVNGESYFVKHGDLIVLDQKDEHAFRPDGSIGIFNCLINPRFLSEDLIDSFNLIDILSLTSFHKFQNIDKIQPLIKFSDTKYNQIESIFEAMELEFTNKETGYITIIRAYIEILLTKILRQIRENDRICLSENIEKITPEILKYIEENYNRKISLKELAQQSFYSPSYFSRVFKECYGKNLTTFVNELRINEAIRLLSTTDLSVEAIALQVGYVDKKNFYTIFKHLTGKTPGFYRS